MSYVKITYCNMLSGAFPTLKSLELRIGFPPPSSESLNWEIISLFAINNNLLQLLFSQLPNRNYIPIEKTRTIPSIVTLTTRSPVSASPEIICTPMLTVVCWPKRTILVPERQSQHTSALSAPAETRLREDNATARIPLR